MPVIQPTISIESGGNNPQFPGVKIPVGSSDALSTYGIKTANIIFSDYTASGTQIASSSYSGYARAIYESTTVLTSDVSPDILCARTRFYNPNGNYIKVVDSPYTISNGEYKTAISSTVGSGIVGNEYDTLFAICPVTSPKIICCDLGYSTNNHVSGQQMLVTGKTYVDSSSEMTHSLPDISFNRGLYYGSTISSVTSLAVVPIYMHKSN